MNSVVSDECGYSRHSARITMGNSVGFYAVSRDLGSSRVLNPHGSDLNLLTDPGGGSSNVQRLSVTCLDIDGEVSRLSYLEENEGSETSSTVPTKSIASYGSRLSVHSCPESSQDVRVEQVKNVVPENKSISADTFRPPNLETWRDIDSDASSQPNTEPAQDVGEEKVHTEFSRLTSMSHYLEISPDIPSLKDASVKQTALDRYAHNSKRHDHYIPLQSTKVIESLLLELQEGDPTLLSPVGSMVTPLREDPERERPIIYTATNAADWRLGTILEESGSSQKQPCSPEAKSTENIDKYNSSDDDDGMTIGSAVNVTDIEAEREKEEGIQLCLEPYEDKIERIEEYLNSSDSHSSTIDKKAGVEAEMGHSRRQSSVDVSAVIGGNHNITYLHFGSGLEDDVTKVVSSEYSQGVSCTTSTPAFGEDSLVSEIHLFIDDYNPSIKDSPVPHAKTQPVPCERSQSNKKCSAVPKETRPEGVSKVSEPEEEEQYQEALEVNEVTESWGQRLVPPLSAGSQNGVSAGKTGTRGLAANESGNYFIHFSCNHLSLIISGFKYRLWYFVCFACNE